MVKFGEQVGQSAGLHAVLGETGESPGWGGPPTNPAGAYPVLF